MADLLKNILRGLGIGCICACCGCRFFDDGAYRAGGVGLCSACDKLLKYTPAPHFFISGSYTSRIAAPLFYTGILRRVILNMKFADYRSTARLLARIMYDVCRDFLMDFDIIVLVPISDERYNERGYNQSELIAEELSRLMNIEYVYGVAAKLRDTPHQAQRIHNRRMEDIDFYFDVSGYVHGKRVLIVDDVHTTGLTMDALAYKVRKAGAVYVCGVCLARKLTDGGTHTGEYDTRARIRDSLNAARMKIRRGNYGF